MLRCIAFFLFTASIYAQSHQSVIDEVSVSVKTDIQRVNCKTPPLSSEQIIHTKAMVEDWLAQSRDRPEEQLHILVAFHVIHASDGTGNISDAAIYDQFEWLNYAFEPHNIFFTVDTIDRTENDDWFNDWYGNSAWPGMNELSIDPYHYLNAYSANLWIDGIDANGWAYMGQSYGPSDYRQSINLAYQVVQWGHDTATHEAGHHLGLSHTFLGDCTYPNDGVDDTPQMHSDYNDNCDDNQDSCPDDEGNDPVHNYMNYTSQSCRDNFTQGQDDLMSAIISSNHYGYYENIFQYPNLQFSSFSVHQDTDGDGVLNPGDTARVRISIENQWGANADSILLTLSSDDDRLVILDSTVQFDESLEAGDISFGPIMDWFEIYVHDDVSLGNMICDLNITTVNEDHPYELDFQLQINVTLNQYGFPIEGMVIKSSPIIGDFDDNGISEIYYGSDNGNLYGYTIAGYTQYGFPFSAGDDIRSSPAVADVDNDGSNEIIFGSNDGKIYVLSTFASEELIYTISGSINGSPAIVDLDLDGDYEIVFTSYDGVNSSGKVYAIDHDGNNVYGFPVDLNEKMMVGAAAGDLEGDGNADIVVCTWDDNIYAIDNSGYVKSGFPFTSTHRFNAPPTLVDLDGDGDLEIVAGNDDGLLHVLHHDGTEMASYDVGDDIRGGISVADLNDDGSHELLFAGYDDMIHVWNPMDNVELDGWPVDMEYNSLTEPVTADLDNDGDLEVVAAMKSGMVYVFHHDATLFNNFPTNLSGNIESSPAIGDLDSDGDYELIFGTTLGLKVLDIKTDKGGRLSWKLHRGNLDRTGSLAMTLVAVDHEEDIIPKEFYVSPNYPNPFNPSTRIDIQLAERSGLDVKIFDATGRLVNTLINKELDAGYYTVKWNGLDAMGQGMPTGVYFIQVASGVEISTQKMILIK